MHDHPLNAHSKPLIHHCNRVSGCRYADMCGELSLALLRGRSQVRILIGAPVFPPRPPSRNPGSFTFRAERLRWQRMVRPQSGLLRGGGSALSQEPCPQGEPSVPRCFAHRVGSYAGVGPPFRRSPVPRANHPYIAASPTEWAPTVGVGPRLRRSPVPRANHPHIAASPTEWAPTRGLYRAGLHTPDCGHPWVPHDDRILWKPR
jgi:hypothetical protein